MRPYQVALLIVTIVIFISGTCFIPGSNRMFWRDPRYAWADPLPNSIPAVNTPLVGCVEGRAVRIINGAPACATTTTPPTLSGCTGGAIDTTATDFVGQITLPAGLTSCTIVMSKLYSSPPLICFLAAQTSGLTLTLSGAVTGNNGTTSTLTVPFGLSLTGAKFGYICTPG